MVDLRKKPYYLSEEAVQWVEDTIKGMTEEEKIGQLFIGMIRGMNEEQIQQQIEDYTKIYHLGGIRYMNMPPEALYQQNTLLQAKSKLPLLIAANAEAGGNGAVGQGTPVATGAAIAAADSEDLAYQVGKIGSKEAAAIGCNWNFSPIVDLTINWRNTVVQTRAYNDNPDDVIRYSRAYLKGTEEENLITCIKHFPGDGTEENDQHLMMGVNDLEKDEWMRTFGKVFQTLIDDGVMTVMAGHIALPSWQRALSVEPLADKDIKPATLSNELITGLLKEKMGFNGLVVTDASHMVGLTSSATRGELVPGTIAAGCDMFLFMDNPAEDFGYMLEGYRNGIITEERLEDALMRILGLKAQKNLHKKQAEGTLMPPKEGLSVISSTEHKEIARQAADAYITLVKDSQNMLPLTIQKHRRIQLVFIEGDGMVVAGKAMGTDSSKTKKILIEGLQKKGFEVDELVATDIMTAQKLSAGQMRERYDAVLVVLDVVSFVMVNSVRIKWPTPLQQPWYVKEVPTAFISLNLTNHLIDLTMSRTYINAHMDHDSAVEMLIEKLVGNSAFKGRSNENVWCGRWDTKL